MAKKPYGKMKAKKKPAQRDAVEDRKTVAAAMAQKYSVPKKAR